MPSLNKVVLVGRLVRDPEMRYTTSGLAVTNFTIAVDRRAKNQQGERQTDFFRCSAWRQTAEFVSNYLTKGRLVAVEGRIELNKYVGQDGQEKQTADIVCDHVEGLDSNREQGEGGSAYNAAPAAVPRAGGNAGGNNDYHAEAPAGGDNGYYPDDDMSAAPPQQRGGQQNRPAPPQARPQGGQGGGTQRPAQTMNRPAAQQGGNRPAPQAAYPAADDFDDSDPFADE